MKPGSRTFWHSGFSMVEVLVALVVLSVGLLGIAKMQALGISSTSVAGKRALAALQADGLAAAMHENRAYWTSNAAVAASPQTFSGVAAAVPSCAAGAPGTLAPCTPAQLATYDLQVWAQGLAGLLPNYTGTVTCLNTGNCSVTITWTESTLGIDTNGAAAAQNQKAGTNKPVYVLFVEP